MSMQFHTPVPISKSNCLIDYHSKIVSLGSCFAVNMAEKFDYFKFQSNCNPFGILFHPLALEKMIGLTLRQKTFEDSDIFFHNETWHSFDTHSDLNQRDQQTMLAQLNANVTLADSTIKSATHLILTLGTAWIYRRADSGEAVANCHKLPQQQFKKELLSVEAIQESLERMVSMVLKKNPGVQIIFTISPVRHLKDGFVENQWSKSNLISALHKFLYQKPENGHYFPSYEIMMDELRDYRFYAEDMIHPSKTAVDYIWKRFSEAWISDSAQSMMDKVGNIQKGLAHRPFDPESDSHQQFLSKLQLDISTLQKQFPHLKF